MLASKKTSTWLEDANVRQANKDWTKRSFKIAVRILREIRAQKPINGMTQRKLAEAMGVSAQYINKVVKGKENLTLETISKIEQVLGISLIQVPTVETITYQSSELLRKHIVNRNNSKVIGTKVISISGVDRNDYEPEYTPTGTYG
ncbi:MAG: helix-turn-helix transcriptional regulator [Prolixibacteraceae bacterium]|nr:helix-turn-helix transcriptional regulator [Prolixibacteraceae bacterium]MBT6766713.1 helix-turn-helix transcriptional regulator [Prolixibacteraceae bacterium]MBT7000439.1 helix-turn-helix transcriptional regulator [Prolixibacteraceae bacterium]MBT7397268.1 helix-turn-helix transcriptional regulator [Prolixibacteraceae bacterium]